MSAARMLNPSDGIEGVKRFVVDTVRNAGPNPCPPVIVGIGLGGTLEITREISDVADACLDAVFRLCLQPLTRRLGQPFHAAPQTAAWLS